MCCLWLGKERVPLPWNHSSPFHLKGGSCPPLLCLFTQSPSSSLPESHLCDHDQPNKEGDDRHPKDEDLPPVLLAEHTGVHIHQRCHQAFYAHKLDDRAKELEGKRVPQNKLHQLALACCSWAQPPRLPISRPQSCPDMVRLDPSFKAPLCPGRASTSGTHQVPSCFKVHQGMKLTFMPPAPPLPAHPHPLISQLLDTWLSSPRRMIMKKKQQAQRGEKGSITTARG